MTQPAPPPPPLQASDPARLTDGQIVPRFAPPPSTLAGSFRFDPEQAPRVRLQLTVARDELQDLRAEAVRLGRISPPALDQVSLDAASTLGATAAGGTGSLVGALEAGIDELSAHITKLQSDEAAYRATEGSNQSRLSTKG